MKSVFLKRLITSRAGFATGILKYFLIAALLVVFLVGQTQTQTQAFAKEPVPDAKAVLPVETLEVKTAAGNFRFSVEIADDARERSAGLMFRETMLPTHGMLFDFKTEAVVTMWMENTPLSLDMIFIRPDGTVARIATDTVPFSRDIISSGEPVSHVLELNAGITRQIGLKVGDKIAHRLFMTQQD